jgi:hypothetical protein
MGRRYLKPIVLEPYGHTLFLCVGQVELAKMEKAKGIDCGINVDGVLGAVVPMADQNGVVFHMMYLGPELEESTLFHEALHVTHFMLEAVGVPLGIENTELICYTQEYVVREVSKEVDLRLNQMLKAQEKALAKLEEKPKKKKRGKKK